MRTRFAPMLLVIGRRLVKVASLCILLLHLAMTILYVLPPNPVKVPVAPLLDRTIGYYARQNWSLFAPNPVNANQALLAKCVGGAEMQDEIHALVEHRQTTGWADLSSPLWSAFQDNRFTAYDRLVRPHTNVLRTYLSGGSSLAVFADSCNNKNDQAACKVFEDALVAVRKASEPFLRRVGSAFCKDSAPASAGFVALRVRTSPVLPWSKRHDPASELPHTDVSLGIYPIDDTVVSAGLFKAASLQ